jgi:hypothetical protein
MRNQISALLTLAVITACEGNPHVPEPPSFRQWPNPRAVVLSTGAEAEARGLRFTIGQYIRADTLRLPLTVDNTTSQPVSIFFGACPVYLQLVREDSGEVAWDTGRWRSAGGPLCPSWLGERVLAPAATTVFEPYFALAAFGMDTLRVGVYRVESRVEIDTTGRPWLDPVAITVGTLEVIHDTP